MPAMRRTSRPAPATREPPSQVKATITPRPAPNRARRELAALQAMELYPICPAPSPSTSPSPSLVQKTSVLYSTDNERVSFAPSSMMPSAASPPPPPPARAAPCAELHSATLPPLRSATAHHQTAERLAYVLSLRLKELVNQKLSRRRAEYAIAHTMDAYPLPDLLQGEGVASTPPPPTEVESIEEAELPPIPPLNLVNAGAFSSELTPTAAATSSRPVEESNLEDGIRGAFFGPDFLRPDEGPSPLSWNPENRNKLERLLGKINRHEASVAQSHTEAGNRADLIRIIKLRPQPNHNRGLFAGMVDRYTTRSGLWITGRKADDGERIRPIAWRLLQQKQDDEGTPAAYRVVPAAPPLSSAAVSAHPDPSTATHTTVPSTTTSEPPQGDVCRGIHFDERALALVVPPTASQQQPRHPESRKLVRHRPRHPYHHGDDFAPQAPHQVLKSTADGDGLNFEWEVGNPDDAYQPPLRKSYAFIDSLGSSFSSIMEELCRGMGKSLEKMRAVLTPEERALARKRLWAKRKMDSRVIIKNAKQKSYAKFQSNQSIPIPKELQAFLPLGATYVPGVGFRDVDGRTIVIPKHLMGIYKKYCAAQDAAFEKAAKRKDVETARESERRKAGRLNVPHGGRYEPGVGFFDAQGKKIERVADLLTTIPPALRGILPEGARYLPGVGFVDALGHPIVVKPEHQELLQHYADQYSATFGEAALTPQDLDHTVTEEEVRAFYLATLDRGSAEGLDGDWARAQDGTGADSFADLSAATIDQRHALSTTVLYDDNGVRMDGTIDAAKMAEARHRRRQGDTRSVLTELEGLDDSFNGGFTDFFFTDDSILNHGDSAYRRISGSEGNMISVWKDEVVEGFRISNELLNLKFRAEAKEEYGALVQERDALRKELASQLTTLKDFKLDIVRLSGVVEGVDKDQYAIELTSDASHYAEEHELKIVLQAEEVDQVAHGFLDQFSKGKTAQRDEACQVSEEDLGFSDEDARRVEAQMEELLMHERGLMHAIKLATIGVANIMNFHASLELESTCKECFFIFEQPRTLWPCGHTFCQRCLTGLYNKNDELICGECGSLCEVGYTPNLSMELVSNYQVGQDTNRETGGPHGHTIEALLRSLVKDLLATQKNYHV